MNITIRELFFIYLAAINLITFIVYGVDKSKAIKHKWRIPEATLIILAVIGGSIGALIGMGLFHHKIRKYKFKIGIPVILILQIILIIWIHIHFG